VVQRQSSRLDIGFIRSVVVEFRNAEEHSDHQSNSRECTGMQSAEMQVQYVQCNMPNDFGGDLNHTRKHRFVHPSVQNFMASGLDAGPNSLPGWISDIPRTKLIFA